MASAKERLFVYMSGSYCTYRDPIRSLPMTMQLAFSSRRRKLFPRVDIRLHKSFARVANTFICSAVVMTLAWGWGIWLAPLNADASSENGLIFYAEAGRPRAEADQKYNLQLIEDTDTNKQTQEHQPVTDTTNEILSRKNHE